MNTLYTPDSISTARRIIELGSCITIPCTYCPFYDYRSLSKCSANGDRTIEKLKDFINACPPDILLEVVL